MQAQFCKLCQHHHYRYQPHVWLDEPTQQNAPHMRSRRSKAEIMPRPMTVESAPSRCEPLPETAKAPDGIGKLVLYDGMCHAIAEAHRLDEVKDIRDQARALELYARQANNFEAEDRCKEIRLRAERKWGQLYSGSEKAKGVRTAGGGAGAGGRMQRPPAQPPTLADMGMTKDQSSRWQKLGAVPDDEFEAAVAERRVDQLAAKPEKPTEPVNADVLWLWGRLREFRERGLLDQNRAKLTETATDHMIKEIDELAPLVGEWLGHWVNG